MPRPPRIREPSTVLTRSTQLPFRSQPASQRRPGAVLASTGRNSFSLKPYSRSPQPLPATTPPLSPHIALSPVHECSAYRPSVLRQGLSLFSAYGAKTIRGGRVAPGRIHEFETHQ